MPYTIVWKDGSVTNMDDSEFVSMPKEMETEIGDISQTPPTAADGRSLSDVFSKEPIAVDATSTIQQQPPSQLSNQELMNKAYQKGYAGLSDDEKARVDSFYSSSKAAQTMSLDRSEERRVGKECRL